MKLNPFFRRLLKSEKFIISAVTGFSLLLGVWTATSFIKLASSEVNTGQGAPGEVAELEELPAQPPQQNIAEVNRKPQQVEPQSDLPPPPPLPEGVQPQTNGQTPPPNAPTQVLGAEPTTSKLATEVESFLVPYIYDVEGRRDPFQRYYPPGSRPEVEVQSTESEPTQQESIASVQPLQRFALEEIQLVGIMWDVEAPRAMFIAGNRMHILNKDERIGRNDGYIAAIREGEVVVVESAKVRDKITYNTRVMKLPR